MKGAVHTTVLACMHSVTRYSIEKYICVQGLDLVQFMIMQFSCLSEDKI